MSSSTASGRNSSARSAPLQSYARRITALAVDFQEHGHHLRGVYVVIDDEDSSPEIVWAATVAPALSPIRLAAFPSAAAATDPNCCPPGPALKALHLTPPCISPARAPAPGRCPVRRRSGQGSFAWANSSNTAEQLRGMPMPGSAPQRSHRRRLRALEPAPRCAAASVYLAALFSRLANTCASRVASTRRGPARGRRPRAAARAPRSTGDAGLTAVLRGCRRGRRWRLRSSTLAARDPRHVEQVVDQMHHWLHLALDDVARLLDASGVVAGMRAGARAALRIGASGLRSSCASIARNSSLRRSVSFSFSSLRRRASSVNLRSLTSSAMPVRRIVPSPAKAARAVMASQCQEPSGWRRRK